MKRLLAPEENEYGRERVEGSSLKQGTSEVSGLMLVLVGIAVLLLIGGFVATDNAITQTAFFAAAAVVAIFARLAQAGRHHQEVMDALRDLKRSRG